MVYLALDQRTLDFIQFLERSLPEQLLSGVTGVKDG